MADTGKQSPFGLNVIGSYLLNQGLSINPVATTYMGSSKSNSTYTFGKCVQDTSLRLLTYAINDAFVREEVSDVTYDNLISIGKDTIPALGNSIPPTYVVEDPTGTWTDLAEKYGDQQGVTSALPGPATSGYPLASDTGAGQEATWLPYDTTNPNKAITQWGYIRLHALQAWNEFNWNNEDQLLDVEYKEFLSSFLTISSFIDYNNQIIISNQNAKTFLDGTYSNMNDLITSDILGVNLANKQFGIDLERLGKVLNLSKIDSFGLPSVLLETIGQNNGVIEDLVLALLASGLNSNEIQSLIQGNISSPTKEQERKIYSAFLIIIGENLAEILAAIQCSTLGIDSLADLLNVRKLFPNSYQSLTVPKYNRTLGLPTNSKTYYPIYLNNGINEALTTPEMNDYVGIQLPKGIPTDNYTVQSASNINLPSKGFGSYLENILPKEQAIAAGAFSFSMRQIKNIEKVNITNFANAVKSLESNIGLDLTNGTSKPTNQNMIANTQSKQALGSGPYGTYTMSDFFGSMSGLPYPWEKIYDRIKQLETTNLYEIYKQLFLAVTWEQATATITSEETAPGVWTVTDITITNPGGGYGRENALPPVVTIDSVPVTATIGTDDLDANSNTLGTFGRITNIALPTTTFGSQPTTITIAAPSGGGFPAMDTVIQGYIDQANNEIANIAANNQLSSVLNAYWNILGSQLTIEQRSRYIALSPVEIPKNLFLNQYPNSINIFVDSIPALAQDTRPHMTAQTLEAISDFSNVGGQSTVGLMREARNQIRLNDAGIPLDNNIPVQLSAMDNKTLTTNNTLAAGINNSIPSPLIDLIIDSPEVYGNVTNGVIGFTNPAWHSTEINGQIVSPAPNGTYIPSDTNLVGEFLPTETTTLGDITSILDGQPFPSVGINVPASTQETLPNNLLSTAIGNIVVVALPEQLETIVPLNLDSDYTGTTLFPATYDVNEAVEKIIECNCDCWLE
jgi:hypothetical protein